MQNARVKKDNGPLPETTALIGLTGVFLARTVGQLLVSRGKAKRLPPMDQWYAEVFPYNWLLGSQVAILGLQAAVDAQAAKGEGPLVDPNPEVAKVLKPAAKVYVAGMGVRYVYGVVRYPERRWLGKTIPIFAHLVLAAYVHNWAKMLGRKPAE